MLGRLGAHLTEHAVGYVALFIAIGGTSYAAVSLPRNSVGTAQLRAGSVTAPKLAKRAVDSSKVKNGTLLAKDFAAGQLPAGPKGDTGPAGPAGAAGAKGDPGPAGLRDFTLVTASSGFDMTGGKFARVTCPPGYLATGGGFFRDGAVDEPVFIDDSAPQGSRGFTPPLGGWVVSAHHDVSVATAAWSISAIAICASVG
jgi:hypothetical protein